MVATESTTIRDNELLIRQDPEAFARLVSDFEARIASLARSLGLAGADIDEAVAEVFVNVYRALPGFDGRAQLTTWIYRIACRAILKARARLRARPTALLVDATSDPKQPLPETSLVKAESHLQVWRAVAQLEPRQALAVELYYRRELPLAEVAAALDCPQGTVKTLLFRARERLRILLGREGI